MTIVLKTIPWWCRLVVMFGAALSAGSAAAESRGDHAPEVRVEAVHPTARIIVGRWNMHLELAEGVDWEPLPLERTVAERTEGLAIGSGAHISLDGRRLAILTPGQAVFRSQSGYLIRYLGRRTSLSFDSDLDELCGGPVEIAVLGLNVEGEETVLRVTGEVTDARWRRRHCKAVG